MQNIINRGMQFAPAWHRPWVRYIEGEQGGAPTVEQPSAEQPPATPAATPPAPAAPPAPTPPAAPQQPAQPPVNVHGNTDDYIRELRNEAKERREALTAAQSNLATTVTERDEARAENANLQRTNAVLLHSSALGANPAALLDSTSFMTALAAVDLANEDDVKAAITTALEKNSALKAGPTLPFTNGGGAQGGTGQTPNTLQGAISAAMQAK